MRHDFFLRLLFWVLLGLWTGGPRAEASVYRGMIKPALSGPKQSSRRAPLQRIWPGGRDFGAVFIGSGPAGLTAALQLAKMGKRVCVLEKNYMLGGTAEHIQVGSSRVPLSLHNFIGAGAPPKGGAEAHAAAVLKHLGVAQRINFLPLDPYGCVDFATSDGQFQSYQLPGSKGAFVQAFAEQFGPQTGRGVRRLIERNEGIRRLSLFANRQMFPGDPVVERLFRDQVGWRRLPRLVAGALPHYLRDMKKTAAAVDKRFIANETARRAVEGFWPYLGLPPELISALFLGGMNVGMVLEGNFFPEGGSEALVQAFADELTATSPASVIRTEAAVKGVVVKNRRAVAVKLAGGEEISADLIISSIDPRRLYGGLVDREHVPPAVAKELARRPPSTSLFKVYLEREGDAPPLPAHEVMVYPRLDHRATWQEILAGAPGVFSVHSPSRAASLSPRGRHTLVLTTLAPSTPPGGERSWAMAAQRHTARVLALANQWARAQGWDDLSANVRAVQTRTPADLQGRLGTATADGHYGWANTPDLALPEQRALGGSRPQDTPIPGLVEVGHFIGGTGFPTVISDAALRARYWGQQN